MCLLFHCLMMRMGEGCLMSHHCHRQIEMKRASAFEEVAERSGHCSFCLADYGGEGVLVGELGRYYEEWWAEVGGSLRCKVLHLVPHWAVKRCGPNRWQNSPSKTSQSLSILTQGTQVKLCGQACIRWLVPLVLNMGSWINIVDIAQLNYYLKLGSGWLLYSKDPNFTFH